MYPFIPLIYCIIRALLQTETYIYRALSSQNDTHGIPLHTLTYFRYHTFRARLWKKPSFCRKSPIYTGLFHGKKTFMKCQFTLLYFQYHIFRVLLRREPSFGGGNPKLTSFRALLPRQPSFRGKSPTYRIQGFLMSVAERVLFCGKSLIWTGLFCASCRKNPLW